MREPDGRLRWERIWPAVPAALVEPAGWGVAAVATLDGAIRLVDTRTGRDQGALRLVLGGDRGQAGVPACPTALAAAPGGDRLLAGTAEGWAVEIGV